MSGKEYTAKSIEEALEKALNEMMLTRDDIEYEVLVQPSKGILGFGKKDAVVRVKKKVIEELKHIVNDIKEERKAAVQEIVKEEPVAVKEPEPAPVEEMIPEVVEEKTETQPVKKEKLSARVTHWAIPKGAEDHFDPDKVIRPTLRKGSRGAYVTLLQTALMQKGYALPKYGADGDYGAETAAAVKQLQQDGVYAIAEEDREKYAHFFKEEEK